MKRKLKLSAPREGLTSRLKKLFTFLARAREIGAEIEMHWPVNAFCTGHFLEVFEPVKDVRFVDVMLQPEFVKWHPHPKFPVFGSWLYEELVPLPHVRSQVDALLDWKSPVVAVHARRTDMQRVSAKIGRTLTSTEDILLHLDTFFKTQQILLATDNRATQELFIARYGDRVKTNGLINRNSGLRLTSMEDSVVDLLGCVAADSFVGTVPSAYSTFINHCHNLISRDKRRSLAGVGN